MKRIICLLLIILLISFIPLSNGNGTEKKVFIARIDGMIAEGTENQFEKAIDIAEKEGGAALIVMLDTPGGLSNPMKEIIKEIEGAKIPVIVYIAPEGAYSFSAGTFILLSSHLAAMAPSTAIGACQPRIINPATGMAEEAPRKEINAYATYISSIAERHGRNSTVAKRFVTENLALGPSGAVENNTVEIVAGSIDDLIEKADGMKIRGSLNGVENLTFHVKGAKIVNIGWNFRDKLLNYLTDPQIASLLLTIGILGLIFGFLTPGFHLPETLGAIFLVLSLYGLSYIGVNAAGIILIVLGFIFIIIEVHTPTFGFWTAAAIAAFIFGIVLIPASNSIYEMPEDWFISFRIASILAAVAVGAFFAYALTASLKARMRKPRLGNEEFIGMEGVAITDIAPKGQIKVRGKIWKAEAVEGAGEIREGEEVIVVGKKRMVLKVKKRK
ncbi:MAG: nodulation protein NfeD [Candidatus Thermoplasmatota archaeon]|nr:nodulation protein NfeD [Candidatus Thermoplasmatota archaeon]